MKKSLLWLALLPLPVCAQVSNPGVRYVATAPSGSCPAKALPVQVSASNEICTCGAGAWVCNSGGGGGGTPGGTSGQLQWNNTTFAGAGLTDGSHFAFGVGAALNSVPTDTLDGTFTFEAPAITSTEETSTAPNFENGSYVGLTLNPSAPSDDGVVTVGNLTRVDLLDSANYNADESTAIVGSWGAVISEINSPNAVPGTLDGSVGGAYIRGTAEIPQAIGAAVDAFNFGSGTVDSLTGLEIYSGNIGTGEISLITGLDVNYYTGVVGGTTDAVYGIHVESPDASGEPVTQTVGLQIDEQCGPGIGAYCLGIDSIGADNNFINGPMIFGDIVSPGILTLADGTTHIATAGGDGWQFNCSDCDTPLTEGATCTAAGDHAGGLAIALRGDIKCF